MKVLSAGVLAVVLMAAGCGGDKAESSAAPPPKVITETVIATEQPEAPTSGLEPEPEIRDSYPYKGYPKVVAKADVPSQMHLYVTGPKAVAVAPGVFTEWIQGVSPRAAAKSGALFGYCAAVKQAKKKLHNGVGFTCW